MGKTKTLSDLVATSGPLRAWLESLPPDEVVGKRGCGECCPAAAFLRANGFPKAEAGGVHFWSKNGRGSGRRPWPAAVTRFIRLVDADTEPLTAKRCLALLDRAEREAGG